MKQIDFRAALRRNSVTGALSAHEGLSLLLFGIPFV